MDVLLLPRSLQTRGILSNTIHTVLSGAGFVASKGQVYDSLLSTDQSKAAMNWRLSELSLSVRDFENLCPTD